VADILKNARGASGRPDQAEFDSLPAAERPGGFKARQHRGGVPEQLHGTGYIVQPFLQAAGEFGRPFRLEVEGHTAGLDHSAAETAAA